MVYRSVRETIFISITHVSSFRLLKLVRKKFTTDFSRSVETPYFEKTFCAACEFFKKRLKQNFDVLKHLIGKFLPEKMPFFDARLK